jgi:hypothetical protein
MLHPALIVLGILFLIQRQLGFGYVNPFDGRHLDDPLTLWYKLQLVIDPVKLYVGNVSGPIGATSAGAVLIGVTYLWYTRKISLGIVTGFLCGVAALALVIRSDLGFQLASGPSLFLAGYIAADRRRVLIPERFTFAFGLAAGMATMVLRWYGEGQQAAWQGLLLVSVVATIVLRAQDIVRGRIRIRMPSRAASLRTLTVESGEPPDPHRLWAPVRQEARQPVMAMSPVATAYSRGSSTRPVRSFDMQTDSNDLVRQMRHAATHGSPVRGGIRSPLAIGLALAIINPVGLLLTWTTRSLNRPSRLLLTGVSVLWYLAVAGAAFLLLTHR